MHCWSSPRQHRQFPQLADPAPLHSPCRLLHWLWPQMHPPYIHALRIDPTRLDAVRLDRLRKSLSDDDAELQGGSA